MLPILWSDLVLSLRSYLVLGLGSELPSLVLRILRPLTLLIHRVIKLNMYIRRCLIEIWSGLLESWLLGHESRMLAVGTLKLRRLPLGYRIRRSDLGLLGTHKGLGMLKMRRSMGS